jgi:DNA-binding MarR family transcriptional regulator
MSNPLRSIEYEIALLVRLTTTHSPQLGRMDRSEYLLLSEMEKHGPLAINILAEKLKLNLSTASRQVAALETKKLIERFPDPQNGRISLIEISPEGQSILQKVQQARYNVYNEILHNWSEEERLTLAENLTRLNQDFKAWRT